ncbi:MAG TPA: deoxyribose-phosphate aldolase [Ruminococcaceae bacterium]|nr:deoxyribose-phosphate aldolase [Oscillospiraceae bacterium]
MGEKGPNYKPEYAKYFDHTKLYPEATTETIREFCAQAREYGFAAVCVQPCHVKMVAELLKGSEVNTATVVGFPLGGNTTNSKVFETKEAVENGANEIDMVLNIGSVKDANWDYVEKDIQAVVDAASSAAVKVIIEARALTDDEKVKACQISEKCGAKFVKTCSGFYGTVGATVEDVALMRKSVSDKVQVKASMGIRTREDADKLIAAGAVRFGSSGGPKVVDGD